MDQYEDFENQWRGTFENASELPPRYVWEQIEARLDKEDEERVVVIPFWQRWQTWSAAASIVAFLVVSGVWLHRMDSPSQKQGEKIFESKNGKSPSLLSDMSSSKVPNLNTTTPESQISQQELKEKQRKKYQESFVLKKSQVIKQTWAKEPSLALQKDLKVPISSYARQRPEHEVSENIKSTLTARATQVSRKEPQSNDQKSTTPITLELLSPKELTALRGPSKKQLWVAYQSTEMPQSNLSKRSSKEYWTALGLMPASFNAGVGIAGRTASSTFAFAGQNALARTADAEWGNDKKSNRAMASYALQWQGGMQIGNRWSFETGLNYLQGNSIFEAINGFNPLTNSYINNLEAAVNLSDFSEKNKAFAQASSNSDKAQIPSLTTVQSVSNSYQYLQIPLQAGFALIKPKRKLSVWFMGGVINNLFLQNSFQTGQERTITLNGADSPYRALSLAASTGVRLQYRFHKRWATTLTGSYQRSLGSTTHKESLFEAHPQLAGVGAGLRYGF